MVTGYSEWFKMSFVTFYPKCISNLQVFIFQIPDMFHHHARVLESLSMQLH